MPSEPYNLKEVQNQEIKKSLEATNKEAAQESTRKHRKNPNVPPLEEKREII